MEMKMKHCIVPAFLRLSLAFIHFSAIVSAQSPLPAPAPTTPATPAPIPSPPAPVPATSVLVPVPSTPGPTNITAVLEKAGKFSTLIRLLKSTQTGDRINIQLNKSRQGLTLFAPADNVFASLDLNSYSDQQKSELVQFHLLPSFWSFRQFQTASNPMNTEAGGTNYGEFPLNLTSSGSGVNITTGFTNATILGTVYTDGQLAVYEVDRVLLPQKFFVTPSPPPPMPEPAPAPTAPSKPKKATPVVATSVPSHAVRLNLMHEMFHASLLVAAVAASWLFG